MWAGKHAAFAHVSCGQSQSDARSAPAEPRRSSMRCVTSCGQLDLGIGIGRGQRRRTEGEAAPLMDLSLFVAPTSHPRRSPLASPELSPELLARDLSTLL